ncbi:DinB family protein [Flavobacterium sp. J27]|uniref:DinB family protein n=1 Tax=Flavobacterium sp. J27 TaxID=2060419 RepID=UPI0010326996|nr:DinB family protein [Flavobacterium sp. J27]
MNTSLQVTISSRELFQKIIENCTLEQLNRVPDGFKNNIIWNIGHIVVTQQLLAYKLSGLAMMVTDEMVAKYQKGTIPHGTVSKDEVEAIKSLLFTTITKTQEDLDNGLFQNYTEYTVSTANFTLRSVEDAMQFTNFHEGIHLGVILQIKKFV